MTTQRQRPTALATPPFPFPGINLKIILRPLDRLTPTLLSIKSTVTENLSVHHMTTSLQADDASNGLQLVNYSSPGLLLPKVVFCITKGR